MAASCLCAMLMLSVMPLRAQDAAPQRSEGPRTGPNAQPLPLAPYATPRTVLPPAPVQDVPPASQSLPLTLRDLQVEIAPGTAAALPRPGWQPGAGVGELALDLKPGDALDAKWIRRQFADNKLLGTPTSTDRIVTLVLLINQAFVQNGYINTGLLLGKQDPARPGVLQLKLVAGRIVASTPGGPPIAVTWSKHGAQGLDDPYLIRRMPSALRPPLNAGDLERDFRNLTDDPAIRTINAQLTPGAQAGEARLVLDVDPQPRFDLYAGAANSRSPSVGGERLSLGGSGRSLLFAGDLTSAELGVTTGLADGVASYSIPLAPRTVLDMRAAYDQAAVVDSSLRALDIHSREIDFDAGVSQKLIQEPLTPLPDGLGWTAARSLVVGVRVSNRQLKSSLLGAPFSFSPGAVDGHTDMTILRATADWVERSERQVLAASFTASFGLDGTQGDTPGMLVPNAHFKAYLAQLNFARRLEEDSGLELRARAAGQITGDSLYSAEQFSVGGQTTVRGYRENLLLADSGLLGSVELACPVTYGEDFCSLRNNDWRTVRVSAFVDGAYVRNHGLQQPRPGGLASIGVGLNWAPTGAFLVNLTYGHEIIKPQPAVSQDLQDRGVAFEVLFHPLDLF